MTFLEVVGVVTLVLVGVTLAWCLFVWAAEWYNNRKEKRSNSALAIIPFLILLMFVSRFWKDE